MDIMTKKIRLIDSVIKIMNDIEDEIACHGDTDTYGYERLLTNYKSYTLDLIQVILNGANSIHNEEDL